MNKIETKIFHITFELINEGQPFFASCWNELQLKFEPETWRNMGCELAFHNDNNFNGIHQFRSLHLHVLYPLCVHLTIIYICYTHYVYTLLSSTYAIPTMCTTYYQSRLNHVSEICLVNILTFSARGVTYF